MSGARSIAACVLFACSFSGSVAHDQLPGAEQTRPILLRGGDLYTVSDGVLRGTDLLFKRGRIVKIGVDLEDPLGGTVIDVRGKRIYPGLIAPATTLGLVEIGAVRATRDAVEVGEITPEVEAHIAYNPDSEMIPTVRSHGVTTAQVAPAGGLLRGRSFITYLDGWTKEDSSVRLTDGLHVNWPSARFRAGWWVSASREKQKERMAEARDKLREAFETARAYALSRAADPGREIDLRWEGMRPLFDGEQPLYVHADDRRQIAEAVEFAEEFGLRMVLVGGAEAYAVTGLLVARDIPVIVGRTTRLPLRDDDDYDLAYRLPLLLHEAGVRFCLGHVTWGGWDVRNLPFQGGQAVAFGLPPEVALRALTLSTAEILGIDGLHGSLEIGKEATLFVSDGDVLDTLGQQVTKMFIRGREVDLDSRHKMLYRKYRQKPPRLRTESR